MFAGCGGHKCSRVVKKESVVSLEVCLKLGLSSRSCVVNEEGAQRWVPVATSFHPQNLQCCWLRDLKQCASAFCEVTSGMANISFQPHLSRIKWINASKEIPQA